LAFFINRNHIQGIVICEECFALLNYSSNILLLIIIN